MARPIFDPFWSAYERSWRYYKQNWRTYNAVLYEMCESHPGHRTMDEVVAKVGLISRAYAAGLERHALPNGEGAIIDVAKTLVAKAPEVEALIQQARGAASDGNDLDRTNLSVVVHVHGSLQRITAVATRSSVRSWVSKYLHFHVPGTPIFDSRAEVVLRARFHRRGGRNTHFSCPDGGDFQYWSFCNRFLSMWIEAGKLGVPRTVKRLDQHLLYLADGGE